MVSYPYRNPQASEFSPLLASEKPTWSKPPPPYTNVGSRAVTRAAGFEARWRRVGYARRASKPAALVFAVISVAFIWALALYALGRSLAPPVPYTRHVAIIGGGPAGMSTAYHLKKLAASGHIPIEITIYENDGRLCNSTSAVRHVYGDGEAIELGISSFPVTGTLSWIVDDLNMRTEPIASSYPGMGDSGKTGFGVYDGHGLVYLEPNPGNFFSRAWLRLKLYYLYGSSPGSAEAAVQDIHKKSQKLYNYPIFPFSDINDAVALSGLEKEAYSTANRFLNDQQVAGNFQRDLINPWVRRDKVQNLGTISALGALSCVPDGPVLSLGESRFTEVCDRMAIASNARVLLETTVLGARKGHWGGWVLASRSANSEENYDAYDAVVLAAPWEAARLEIKAAPLRHTPHAIPYADLHITLFTSPHPLSPKVFPGMSKPPPVILTTPNSGEYDRVSGNTGAAGVGEIGYWSISLLRDVTRVLDDQGSVQNEHLYKVVSPEELSDDAIERLVSQGKLGITWLDRYHSTATYPYQLPRRTFEAVELDQNFWYTAAIHELAGGAEMAALMGSNVAELMTARWKQAGVLLPDDERIPLPPDNSSEAAKHVDRYEPWEVPCTDSLEENDLHPKEN